MFIDAIDNGACEMRWNFFFVHSLVRSTNWNITMNYEMKDIPRRVPWNLRKGLEGNE